MTDAEQYIVIAPNQDEMGRGSLRPVSFFKTEAEAAAYVLRYIGNSENLEVYRCVRLRPKLTMATEA